MDDDQMSSYSMCDRLVTTDGDEAGEVTGTADAVRTIMQLSARPVPLNERQMVLRKLHTLCVTNPDLVSEALLNGNINEVLQTLYNIMVVPRASIEQRGQAADVLARIVADPNAGLLLNPTEVVQNLMRFMQRGSADIKEAAQRALEQLLYNEDLHIEVVAAAGGLHKVLAFVEKRLRSMPSNVPRKYSARALEYLLRAQPLARDDIVKCGQSAVPLLVALLDDTEVETLKAALESLVLLMEAEENRLLFLLESLISQLAHILDLQPACVLVPAVKLLHVLSQHHDGLVQLLASQYRRVVQRLLLLLIQRGPESAACELPLLMHKVTGLPAGREVVFEENGICRLADCAAHAASAARGHPTSTVPSSGTSSTRTPVNADAEARTDSDASAVTAEAVANPETVAVTGADDPIDELPQSSPKVPVSQGTEPDFTPATDADPKLLVDILSNFAGPGARRDMVVELCQSANVEALVALLDLPEGPLRVALLRLLHALLTSDANVHDWLAPTLAEMGVPTHAARALREDPTGPLGAAACALLAALARRECARPGLQAAHALAAALDALPLLQDQPLLDALATCAACAEDQEYHAEFVACGGPGVLAALLLAHGASDATPHGGWWMLGDGNGTQRVLCGSLGVLVSLIRSDVALAALLEYERADELMAFMYTTMLHGASTRCGAVAQVGKDAAYVLQRCAGAAPERVSSVPGSALLLSDTLNNCCADAAPAVLGLVEKMSATCASGLADSCAFEGVLRWLRNDAEAPLLGSLRVLCALLGGSEGAQEPQPGPEACATLAAALPRVVHVLGYEGSTEVRAAAAACVMALARAEGEARQRAADAVREHQLAAPLVERLQQDGAETHVQESCLLLLLVCANASGGSLVSEAGLAEALRSDTALRAMCALVGGPHACSGACAALALRLVAAVLGGTEDDGARLATLLEKAQLQELIGALIARLKTFASDDADDGAALQACGLLARLLTNNVAKVMAFKMDCTDALLQVAAKDGMRDAATAVLQQLGLGYLASD